jgi:hypothetical protein
MSSASRLRRGCLQAAGAGLNGHDPMLRPFDLPRLAVRAERLRRADACHRRPLRAGFKGRILLEDDCRCSLEMDRRIC